MALTSTKMGMSPLAKKDFDREFFYLNWMYETLLLMERQAKRAKCSKKKKRD